MSTRPFSPELLNPAIKNQRQKIENLLFKKKLDFIVDEIVSQLEELFYIRHPSVNTATVNRKSVNSFISSFLNKQKPYLFGLWVFYPWNHNLVHFMPEPMHTELRTARNRNLITKDEQDKFYNATVGIAGLSVGNSAMANLLYAGGPKNLRLADFDTLAGSNTNRIRADFSQLGDKKVFLAAREIYEVNPYAELKLYPEGINDENIVDFLTKPKPLDVLIEEMDNIYLKIKIRFLARKFKIPVVMATDNGDNIILDIERYDLNKSLPILHGDIPEKELLEVTPKITKPEAARIISRWVHPENVAARMQKSLLELGKTLYSWPQLGNAAFLAGCALAYCTRKIITGEPVKPGKSLVSFDEILIPGYFSKKEFNKRMAQSKLFKKVLGLK